MLVGEAVGARSGPEMDPDLESRVLRTLAIADRWGYGLADRDLARLLYGGPEAPARLDPVLTGSAAIAFRDGVAALRGHESLIDKSITRRRTNGGLSDLYFRVAEAFARDLLTHCPFVRAIALSGSTASGGIDAGDDIDFNLVAEDGTKYLVYLTALSLGVKYSLRHGRRFAAGTTLLGLLPKVTCVNVVWAESECRPFVRQDAFLAFELLRSVPIAGTRRFAEVMDGNPWLREHFPQALGRVHGDRVAPPPRSVLARAQAWIARSPRGRRLLDRTARLVTLALHRLVRLSRERDAEARARDAFLRRVKFPYDVFQD